MCVYVYIGGAGMMTSAAKSATGRVPSSLRTTSNSAASPSVRPNPGAHLVVNSDPYSLVLNPYPIVDFDPYSFE